MGVSTCSVPPSWPAGATSELQAQQPGRRARVGGGSRGTDGWAATARERLRDKSTRGPAFVRCHMAAPGGSAAPLCAAFATCLVPVTRDGGAGWRAAVVRYQAALITPPCSSLIQRERFLFPYYRQSTCLYALQSTAMPDRKAVAHAAFSSDHGVRFLLESYVDASASRCL